MARILIVEDKPSLRALLRRLLSAYTVEEADTVSAALAVDDVDLVLSDVRLPDGDGFTVLGAFKQRSPQTEVIMMTAYAEIESAVRAVKEGAYDYLQKPFEPDALLMVVERALERQALRRRAQSAEDALRKMTATASMLGESAPMQRVRDLIGRVADLEVTILLTGESGTGKEVAARTIHAAGRADAPFVAINCGAIPDHLLESELFGHARGAFTGANAAHAGLLEEAGQGTLFLDEIGDMPLALQVKLNRVLEERTFRRLGETRERRLQARVIAATLKDLDAEVAAGRFRQDLHFRLSVYPVPLPPLRARGDDLFLLARHALDRAVKRFSKSVEGFTAEALQALATHRWPGNVRELIHVVDRAVILAGDTHIRATDLPDHLVDAPVPTTGQAPPLSNLSYRHAMQWARARGLRQYLEALLARFDGNVTHAAAQAEIERESLHRLMRKAGVRADAFRQGE